MMMRLPVLIVALVGFAADTDLDKLQGTWELTRAVGRGKEVVPDKGAVTFVIKGDTMKRFVRDVDRNDPLTIKVDATAKPARIDLTPAKPGDPKMLGIYELDGDNLKVCMSATKRPEKFESPEGSDITLLVMKRVKK
jgi:uncharacterized protein (TIGR03067 family)